MSNTIIVYKGRTNIVTVSLGIDVSDDTISSEIRTAAGALIATWDVTFDGDGSDGEVILTMQEYVSAAIAYPTGIMDLKRISGGEPLPVFEQPLEVEFRETVTA
jgi:hypothetical protein